MIIHCKYDDLIDVKKLKNHPKNPNKHGQDQVERLAEIYKYQGVRHPIIVSKLSNQIVAGHGRKLAAIRAGLKEFPVVYQDFEDAEQEYAFLVSDNSLSDWSELDLSQINADLQDLGPDFNLDMLGIKDFTLDISEKEFNSDPDEIPEEVEPKAKLGDIYKLGDHRLMCGDSTNEHHVELLMNGEKADMLLTDPPYGVKAVKSGSVGGDKAFGSIGGGGILKAGRYKEIIGDDTTDTASRVYALAIEMNIPSIILWGGNYYSEFCPPTACWLVWDKLGDTKSNNFADCELAWTNKTSPARIYKQMWRGMIKQGESGKRVHPTQKPIDLSVWSINTIDKSAKNILDLFGGSGSTLIACEKTNRKCFMMELDPHYVDVIIARWEKFTGKTAELING